MSKENKKFIYLGLWVILGALLGILVGGMIELVYLYSGGIAILPRLIFYTITLAAGILVGFWDGPIAWKKIYVEGVRGKKYIIK